MGWVESRIKPVAINFNQTYNIGHTVLDIMYSKIFCVFSDRSFHNQRLLLRTGEKSFKRPIFSTRLEGPKL